METSNQARYDNYRVYRVEVDTEEHVQVFKDLEEFYDSFIFYGHARHPDQQLTIMVPADKIAHMTDLLNRYNVKFKILDYNVQEKIDAELKNKKSSTASADEFDWENYFHLSTINAWLNNLVEKYNFITPIDIGKSYEGRSIRGVKLSRKEGNTGIIVECGIHAREWISPAAGTFILNQLITSDDPNVKYLSENFDWYFLPVVNPDGYCYSFEHDRMWRKTRKPYGVSVGVDMNRNFASNWGGNGASKNPRTYDFAGSSVYSEPEAKHLSDFVEDHIKNHNVRTFLSLHSFSQLLMFPYGHSSEKVSNYDDLKAIGEKAIVALARRYGTIFETGCIHDIIYPSSGGSMDWAKEKCGIPITYTFELRGPPDTNNMFILPANEITPVGWETLDAFVTIIKEAEKLGYYK